MAMSLRGKAVIQHDSAYLSDESDFYGDEAVKQDLEERASTFDVEEWWEHKEISLNEVAAANIAAATESKVATLYNPYEGNPCGRQLGETVEEFLTRLPPATTQVSLQLPWIYIANPYRKAPCAIKPEHSLEEVTAEVPPDEDSDWAKFVVLAGNLLEELTGIKHEIEKKNVGKAKSTITRQLNVQKEKIVKKILDAATELHCTSGKWMIFCHREEINAVWAVVARGTADNELGIAAKVAPDAGDDRQARLICVYTKDFTDMKDVSRVVHKLKDLGLVERKGRPIYYKCDAYTYLGLSGGNQYDIRPSLYNSTDVLQGKLGQGKDGKVDGFFNKKQKDENDWKPLEWE